MKHDELEPLADDLRELLGVERAHATVPADVTRRMAERLARALPLPPPDPGSHPPEAASQGSSSRQAPDATPSTARRVVSEASAHVLPAAGLKVVPLVIAFALGGVTGVVTTVRVLDAREPAPAPTATLVPVTTTPVPAIPSAPKEAPRADDAAPMIGGPQLEPPVSARSLPAPSTSLRSNTAAADGGIPKTPVRSDRRLAEERNLVELARTALSHTRATEALTALEDHARRFPRGRLAEERESLRVPALVMAGRRDEARTRAESFRLRYPQSLFTPVVDQAVKSIP